VSTRDEIVADDSWVFDARVTDAFDDMLARSIPGYAEMRHVVTETATAVLGPKRSPVILDLGASRGEGVVSLLERCPDATVEAIEISEPMLDVLAERLEPYAHARARSLDLTERPLPVSFGIADLVLCVLTLQFVPIEQRYDLLSDVYERLRPGGALILVEKCLGETPRGDALLRDLYAAHKRRAGYSDEQIERKRRSLQNVLVPLPAREIERWLDAVGFAPVERVWQSLSFAGWVAVRP
jgi:tRNA (cmo5U34)-methyltransferase